MYVIDCDCRYDKEAIGGSMKTSNILCILCIALVFLLINLYGLIEILRYFKGREKQDVEMARKEMDKAIPRVHQVSPPRLETSSDSSYDSTTYSSSTSYRTSTRRTSPTWQRHHHKHTHAHSTHTPAHTTTHTPTTSTQSHILSTLTNRVINHIITTTPEPTKARITTTWPPYREHLTTNRIQIQMSVSAVQSTSPRISTTHRQHQHRHHHHNEEQDTRIYPVHRMDNVRPRTRIYQSSTSMPTQPTTRRTEPTTLRTTEAPMENTSPEITIVTALMDIGRGEWGQYRRPLYKYHEFMENLLAMANNMVIFTDISSYQFIHNYRKKLGLMHRTKIHLITFDDLPLSRHLAAAQKIIEDEHSNETLYKNVWDPLMKNHPEAKSAEYDILVNSKTHFLYNATLEDPFRSEFFVWIDAGYGHGNQSVFPYENKWSPVFPANRISLIKLTPEHDHIKGYTLKNLYRRNWSVVSGGFLAGDKHAIGQLHRLVHRKFIELTYQNIVDDDQTVLVLVINSHPHLFTIRQGDWFDAFRLFSPDQSQFGK